MIKVKELAKGWYTGLNAKPRGVLVIKRGWGNGLTNRRYRSK